VEGRAPSDFRKELLSIRGEAAKRREDYNWRPLVDSTNQALAEMGGEP
jgi:hypothetical protein